MSDLTKEHLQIIIRKDFDSTDSHVRCERCIATARELEFYELANEMKADLKMSELEPWT